MSRQLQCVSDMKLAIMQPYFFPYLGYYQLVHAVDTFVMFDDVNFIKRGWIHRNNFLIGGGAKLISIPLKNASQNRSICEIEVDDAQLWREKMLKTIELAYKRAPRFSSVFPVVDAIIRSSEKKIGSLAAMSIRSVAEYLGMKTSFVPSSSSYGKHDMNAEQRILHICKRASASDYINPIGGRELYTRATFEANNLRLRFLEAKPVSYAQYNGHFVPWLSMIDVLMFNTKEQTLQLLNQYTLHPA